MVGRTFEENKRRLNPSDFNGGLDCRLSRINVRKIIEKGVRGETVGRNTDKSRVR